MWKTIRSKKRFFRTGVDNNRTEDLKRAVKDEAYRKKLLEELNSQG